MAKESKESLEQQMTFIGVFNLFFLVVIFCSPFLMIISFLAGFFLLLISGFFLVTGAIVYRDIKKQIQDLENIK